MKYFGDFCFSDDMALFNHIIDSYNLVGQYNVFGFGYGAQKAVSYALESKQRIERLVLFSPMFLNDKSIDFKRQQILSFNNNTALYMKLFLENIGFTKELESYLQSPKVEDLKAGLDYQFSIDIMYEIVRKGILVNVFFGMKDCIIDVDSASAFFAKNAIVYLLKKCNHLLR